MKRLIESLFKSYLSNDPLNAQVKRFMLFQFVIWIVHLLIISLISFFHLILNHSIGTIAEWINERGWQLILLTKFIVLFIFFQFFSLRFQVMKKLKAYYYNGIQLPRMDYLVVCSFFFIGFLSLGNPILNSAMIFQVFNILLSYVGLVLFFLVDFIFLMVLNSNFPLRKEQRLIGHFIFALIFYLGTLATFQYEFIAVNYLFFFLFWFLLYLSEWRRKNWTMPLSFLMLVFAPITSFFGFDPVWQNQFSLFKLTNRVNYNEIIVIILISAMFLHHRKKQEPEYIYRE